MSKRVPDIFFFNPTCEYAVANASPSWQANQLLCKMESDLSSLPMFFANSGDYVLVDSIPSTGFLNQFEKIGFQLPNFITKKEAFANPEFLSLPKGKLLPWGWSPAIHKLLNPLKLTCSESFLNSSVAQWNPKLRDFFSRKFSLEILTKISESAHFETIITPDLIGKVCVEKYQIELLINRWEKVMIKAPWSSSGRGLQPVTKTPVHEKVWEKIMGIVSEQGYAMVEPLLNKAADLAFQFELENRKVTFIGFSYFKTDAKGQYMGNYLNGIPDHYELEISNYIQTTSIEIIPGIIQAIENSKLPIYFEGSFGVDLLVFRNKSGELRLNPCLEINLRKTMGLLSLKLETGIAKGKKGTFNMFYHPESGFLQFCNEMKKKHGLSFSGDKIESGFFPLIEPLPDTKFGAYILI